MDDLFNAKKITEEVLNGLNSDQYYGVDWMQQKANFIKAILDKHALLDFCSARSLKQQSSGSHVSPLGHIFLISNKAVFALTH